MKSCVALGDMFDHPRNEKKKQVRLSAPSLSSHDDVVETLYDRILGRTASEDIIHPITSKIIVAAGGLIDEDSIEEIFRRH